MTTTIRFQHAKARPLKHLLDSRGFKYVPAHRDAAFTANGGGVTVSMLVAGKAVLRVSAPNADSLRAFRCLLGPLLKPPRNQRPRGSGSASASDRAIHFGPANRSACGLVSPALTTFDRGYVDCQSCRESHVFRARASGSPMPIK